jgi:hypothetical protein
MPGVDAAAGTLAVPIWLAGAAAAVLVVALVLAVARAGGVALINSLFRVGLIAAVVLGVWLYVQPRGFSATDSNSGGERRSLDDRKTALMAGAIAVLPRRAGGGSRRGRLREGGVRQSRGGRRRREICGGAARAAQ